MWSVQSVRTRSCGIASEDKDISSHVAIRRSATRKVRYGAITLVHTLEGTDDASIHTSHLNAALQRRSLAAIIIGCSATYAVD